MTFKLLRANVMLLVTAAFSSFNAYSENTQSSPSSPWLKPGSNTMLKAALETSGDLEVIVSDVLIPANSSVPAHSHPGEEFVYIIEGSAIHIEQGKKEKIYNAGDAFVIKRGSVHSPKTTDKPARAIVFRVHVKGQPERILVRE